MKNLKKAAVRRAICVLLTAAMLCADTGMTVYAAEGAEEKALEEVVGETSTEEVRTEDGQAEEPSTGNDRTEEELAEDGTTEEEPDVEAVENTGNISADESVSENDIEEDAEENVTMAARGAEGDVIARGEYKEDGNDITWVLDSNGKLTVEGTGDFANDTGGATRGPWYDNREFIKNVEVNVTGMTNVSFMFCNCNNLEEVDLSRFDTSNVTNMSGMFDGCSSLTSLDVSGFDTGNVTDMSNMFGGCRSLRSLDLKKFDTSNVTNMSGMFSFCSSLTSLDVSGFDTGNVTDMSYMFGDCESLTSLEIKNFDTSNVTNTSAMFYGCSSLTSLDVNSFDTSKVTDMDHMFSVCSSLTSLDVSGFDTGNVTDMSYMFGGCESLTSLDIKNFDTSNVTNMSGMFDGCSSLTSLDVSSFDTGNVTDMSNMFGSCERLTSLDLSGFDVSKILNADYFLVTCPSLSEIRTPLNLVLSIHLPAELADIWYQQDGTAVTEMPKNLNYSIILKKNEIPVLKSTITASKLKTVYKCEDTINIDDITVIYYDADGKGAEIKEGYTTNVDEIDMSIPGKKTLNVTYNGMTATVKLTVKVVIKGSYEGIDWSIDVDGKLSVTGTGNFCGSFRKAPWDDYRSDIISAEIDVTDMTDASYMFYDYKFLTSVDFKKINTVTNMSHMFYDCSRLTDLDMGNFDTSNVTDMNRMFYGCRSLRSLDLKKFDTSNVTNMDNMFSFCSSLTDLDVGNFDTSNITDLNRMFWHCNALTELDVSSFDTSNVTDMGGMFDSCDSLTSLDLKNFDTGKVTDMSGMFDGCSSLTSLDVSSFDTSNVTAMSGMFEWCSSLTSLNVSSFDTGKIINMSEMFYGCSSLPSLDMSSFDTSNVTNMSAMFYGCSSLPSLDVSSFDTGNVTDMGCMFYDCRSLTSLEIKNFDTSKVTDMWGMFYGCSSLTSLDVSSFDTSNVTDMSGMFDGCSSLTILDLGGLDLNKINIDSVWLIDCENLTTIYTPLNLKYSVTLPGESTDKWYQTDGTKITELPQNLNYSILIGKNKVPVFKSAITVTKTKTTYVCGETINIDDLTVIYYGADGKSTEVTEYSTNVDQIDMSTPGTKSLVITYKGLKETVELIVKESGENPTPEIIQIAVPVATPESGRQLTAGSKVTLTCDTAGAAIYYTTGSSEKELTDPTEKSTRYTEPITVNGDVYIKAIAIKGDIRSRTVTLHYTVAGAADKVLKPYAVPGQGTVESGIKVELRSDTPDAAIYYVTGKNANMLGAVPVDDTHRYSEPIEIAGDMVIKAIAVKDGMEISDSAMFVYKVKVVLDPPVAEPASGTVDRGSYISLKTDNGVNIYYTMDQSNPTTSGSAKLYESMIRVDGDSGSTMVIKAAAEKNGVYGKVVTFTYTVSENTVKGLQVMLAGSGEFTYTGSAVTPAVIVTNNGEVLTEGENYTVRYSNNVKAADKGVGKAPKITITGKGNLTKSSSITFSILPKDIGDEEEVVGGNIVVVKGKSASPVLYYGGVKLTAKDFVIQNGKKKYDKNDTIKITGKGNFKGTRDIDVRVVEKKDLKKFTVVIDNHALKANPLIYDGEAKSLDGYFKVYDTADKNKATPLEEYSDYAVIYPRDITNAGKVKFTVVGLGEYSGTVTKTCTIQPKAVKTEDGTMVVNMNKEYPYKNGGVVIPDLTVAYDGDVLIPGKDYKVTYSNNKKVCTDNRAKCIISFMGNYKGSKALVRNFNITPANMNDAQMNGSASVAVGDIVYTGKPGAYKSIPYVTVNGVLLKSADYTVSYYKDSGRTQVIDGKTASSTVNLTDSDKQQTVYVKIEGKGNYTGILTAEYNVYRLAEDVINLVKAKVSFVGGSKAEYTGEGVEPEVEIMYKSGRDWKKVDANDIETYVRVTYINNVNKGKATVMINGSGVKYAGSKTAVFSITPKSMK